MCVGERPVENLQSSPLERIASADAMRCTAIVLPWGRTMILAVAS
jgi:hypothetical protein